MPRRVSPKLFHASERDGDDALGDDDDEEEEEEEEETVDMEKNDVGDVGGLKKASGTTLLLTSGGADGGLTAQTRPARAEARSMAEGGGEGREKRRLLLGKMVFCVFGP